MSKIRCTDALQTILDFMVHLPGISEKWEYGFRLYLTRYVETPIVLVEMEWLNRDGQPEREERTNPALYQWIKNIIATFLASHSIFLDQDLPVFAYSVEETDKSSFHCPHVDWLEITAEICAYGMIPTRHLIHICEIGRSTNFLSFSCSATKAIFRALNAVPETRVAELTKVHTVRHDRNRARMIQGAIKKLH